MLMHKVLRVNIVEVDFLLMLKVEFTVPRLIFDDAVLHSQPRLE